MIRKPNKNVEKIIISTVTTKNNVEQLVLRLQKTHALYKMASAFIIHIDIPSERDIQYLQEINRSYHYEKFRFHSHPDLGPITSLVGGKKFILDKNLKDHYLIIVDDHYEYSNDCLTNLLNEKKRFEKKQIKCLCSNSGYKLFKNGDKLTISDNIYNVKECSVLQSFAGIIFSFEDIMSVNLDFTHHYLDKKSDTDEGKQLDAFLDECFYESDFIVSNLFLELRYKLMRIPRQLVNIVSLGKGSSINQNNIQFIRNNLHLFKLIRNTPCDLIVNTEKGIDVKPSLLNNDDDNDTDNDNDNDNDTDNDNDNKETKVDTNPFIQKVVFSLSTTPRRIDNLLHMLEKTHMLYKNAEFIVINVCPYYKRLDEYFVLSDEMKNTLKNINSNYFYEKFLFQISVDLGPITKLIGGKSFMNTKNLHEYYLIIIDDDTQYMNNCLIKLLEYKKISDNKNTKMLYSCSGFMMSSNGNVKYINRNSTSRTKRCDIIEGFAGICFSFNDLALLNIDFESLYADIRWNNDDDNDLKNSFLKACFLGDDYIISYLYSQFGYQLIRVPNQLKNIQQYRYGFEGDALHKNTLFKTIYGSNIGSYLHIQNNIHLLDI